jgi:thiamine pyrophosphokinase
VLCLDGELSHFGLMRKLELPLIAVDGAANKLCANGLTPDIVIGDLDSVDPSLVTDLKYTKLSDQNTSDFQKALGYLDKNNLLPCSIFGMSGGHIDHIFNNINLFLSLSDCIFIDGSILGIKVTNGKELHLPINTKLSIFGVPECRISTSGLKWDLDDAHLAFAAHSSSSGLFGFNSCFNRTVRKSVVLSVTSGIALVMIYTDVIIDAGSIVYEEQ